MTEAPVSNDDSDLAYIERLALAEPDTTLGKLQRGRGAGWLECVDLLRDEANELLWHCIVFDPRVEQQVDHRGEYYASLARRTGFDVSRLLPERLPPEEPWRDRRLVVEVLTRLDQAGIGNAGTVLLAQLSPEDEMHENVLIEIPFASPSTIARLPKALLDRRDDENLIGTVNRFYEDYPWDEWAADHPRIAGALREVKQRKGLEQRRQRRSPPKVSAPLAELLEHRWSRRNPPSSLVERLTSGLRPGEYEQLVAACGRLRDPSLAFTILGLTNDPSGLAAATAIVEEPRREPREADPAYYARQSAVYRYLRALKPEHTLPIARDWLGASTPRDSYACSIFALHAEPQDIPTIGAKLSETFGERRLDPLVDLIDALARHPQLGPFDGLREVFEGVEHSYARWRAAIVMAGTDSTFRTTYAREGLWDSSEGVRDVAINSVEIRDEIAAVRREELIAQHP